MADITLPYNFKPRPYQLDPWNAMLHPDFHRGLIVVPRRNGKDLLCWNALIAKAMQRVGLYFYMGPYYNQIRQIIWQGSDKDGRRFLDYIPEELVTSRTKLDMRIELVNGSQIKFQGSDNIDSIVGTNPVGIVFTEFSLHKPEAWHYLRPILAENGGWAMFNGTPRGLNHFYKQAMDAQHDPKWFYQYLTRDDTGIPTMEAIEDDRRSGMPESLIQQEYYCAWTASSEETLIPLDIVQPAVEFGLNSDNYSFAPRILGADPAFAIKGDKAVIAKRQGRLLHPLLKFRGMDNMSFASKIADEINQWKPAYVCIDAGRGEGVISRLTQLGYGNRVIPVHFSGKSYSELYLNKRAEIWCRMKDWFDCPNTPSIPYDEDLTASITAPRYWINDRGFIQLESKKALKLRLSGMSPDEGDAVAVTFAEEDPVPIREDSSLTPQEQIIVHQIMRGNEQAEVDYDVLNYLNKEDVNDFYSTLH